MADVRKLLEAVEAGRVADNLFQVRGALASWRNVARDGRTVHPSITGLSEMIDAVEEALAILRALEGGAE